MGVYDSRTRSWSARDRRASGAAWPQPMSADPHSWAAWAACGNLKGVAHVAAAPEHGHDEELVAVLLLHAPQRAHLVMVGWQCGERQ